MQKIWFPAAAAAVTLFLFLQTGCKTAQDYADERAEKASTHFQAAKFRELQQGQALTLQECIRIALKNNLQIRVSELELQVQKELETAEALGMLPRFDINTVLPPGAIPLLPAVRRSLPPGRVTGPVTVKTSWSII